MELKVGDIYRCPEGHRASIVWISENEKVIAVKCPQKHLNKVVKVADHTKHSLSYRHYPTEERKIYTKDMDLGGVAFVLLVGKYGHKLFW